MLTRNASRLFPTEAEAWAFREGVEMVNDTSISELDTRAVPGQGFRVEWTDRDASTEDDPALDAWLAERTARSWGCVCGDDFVSEADIHAHLAFTDHSGHPVPYIRRHPPYEHVERFGSHKKAAALASKLRGQGLTAEIVDGERSGYVVRWWSAGII